MKSVLTIAFVVTFFASATSFADEKPAPPKEIVELLKFYVGNWSLDGKVGDTEYKGKASFRMPAGKHCILGTVSMRCKDDSVTFSLVSGWDSSTGWTTEQGIGADGTIYRLPWRKASPHVDEGHLVGTVNGMKVTEKNRLERKGKDAFVVVCTERSEGDKKLPDMTLSYHRMTGKKTESEAKK